VNQILNHLLSSTLVACFIASNGRFDLLARYSRGGSWTGVRANHNPAVDPRATLRDCWRDFRSGARVARLAQALEDRATFFNVWRIILFFAED